VVTSPDISVVIPVYNSENTIAEVVRKMSEELKGKYDFNFVLVNDGSSDGSYSICRGLAEKDKRVKFVSFFKNFGQLNAILAGMREADGKTVIVMDDDLQNPPSEVHKLIDAIHTGYDFVFGTPKGKMQQSLFRKLGSRFSAKMAEVVFEKPKGLYASSYYAMRKEVAREVVKYDGPYPYISGFIFMITHNGVNIPVEHHARKIGKSNYDMKKLIKLWLNGLTNFSILPLRIATYMGFASAGVGLISLVYIVLRKLLMPALIMPGWTSVSAMVLFFGGVQLLALGMLGEYVGRIFLLMNRNPQYTIREKFNCDEEAGKT
jgi:undecaprenyl-phosphate 4-deoxy-4-formamido-L-arabinose transferase